MSRKDDNKLSRETETKIADFLFDTSEIDINAKLDQRTRINSKDAFQGIVYYDILGYEELLNVKSAREIGQILKNLFIAEAGEGRKEAVESLKGRLTKFRTLHVGEEDTSLTE